LPGLRLRELVVLLSDVLMLLLIIWPDGLYCGISVDEMEVGRCLLSKKIWPDGSSKCYLINVLYEFFFSFESEV